MFVIITSFCLDLYFTR